MNNYILGKEIEKLMKEIESNHGKHGKQGGWPKDFNYRVEELATGRKAIIEVVRGKKVSWKRVDPWGIAFLDEILKLQTKPIELSFLMPDPNEPADKNQYEALKRRLSYLAEINKNGVSITLYKEGVLESLYSLGELSNRPDEEIIRKKIKDRSDYDKPGRLEKDFQTYLFGKGLHDDKRTSDDHSQKGVIRRSNGRLGLLGDDFVRIKNKEYIVEREFPTGVFRGEVKESKRILPTEYVDLVTLNNKGKLAIIELKFDNSDLEIISQVLNYALFFYSYKKQLNPTLLERLDLSKSKPTQIYPFIAYAVSNIFHQRFDGVWKYYSKNEDQAPFNLKKIKMGCMGNFTIT